MNPEKVRIRKSDGVWVVDRPDSWPTFSGMRSVHDTFAEALVEVDSILFLRSLTAAKLDHAGRVLSRRRGGA